MQLHAIGRDRKVNYHDLVGGKIDLGAVKARSTPDGRPVSIEHNGPDFIEVHWTWECDGLKPGVPYDSSLRLTHRDIARLFVEAFGEGSLSEAIQALAQHSTAEARQDQ